MKRTVKLRSQSNGRSVHVSIAPLNAVPGATRDARVVIYAITDVPETVADTEVVRLMLQSADVSFLTNPRYEFRFDQLGVGHILR